MLGYLRTLNISTLLEVWKVFSLFTTYIAYRIHNISITYILSSCNWLAIGFAFFFFFIHMNTKACSYLLVCTLGDWKEATLLIWHICYKLLRLTFNCELIIHWIYILFKFLWPNQYSSNMRNYSIPLLLFSLTLTLAVHFATSCYIHTIK